RELGGVRLLQLLDFLGRQRPAGLAQQGLHEQPAAHPDPPVNPPDGKVNANTAERGAPRDHMLVNAIDQRPVEVKQERRRWWVRIVHLRNCGTSRSPPAANTPNSG